MADSDFSKMKVVDLRRELKARNLSTAGDKSELIARLQLAATKDDDNLSDELDSDIVLDDEVEKEHNLSVSEYQIEREDSEVQLVITQKERPTLDTNKPRPLKRKPPPLITEIDKIAEDKLLSPESPLPEVINSNRNTDTTCAKKIVLNRITARQNSKDVEIEKTLEPEVKNVKIDEDPALRLEMRAKRFGLPVTDGARKEARKLRFGNGASKTVSASQPIQKMETSSPDSLEKLKKRAERFGGSVSKVMTNLEVQEKIERRKAKFGFMGK